MAGAGDLEQLDAQLREWSEQRDYSGIALITRGGVTEFEGCYGLANRADSVPVTPATRFGLASLTKMFTATAIADLVREGRLTFDTPVVNVLPPERRPSTLRSDVTVHHLLTHTSGIADYFEEADADADYAALWIDRPCYRMLRPADYLPIFGDLPPYRGPGERFQYSNAGYIVLGLVIEEVAEQPYIDVVAERVFAAAGMDASGFFALDEARPDVAVGYIPPRAPGGPWVTNVYSIPVVGCADGGSFSTAGDLDRFLTAYGDGSLLGESMRDQLLSPRSRVNPSTEVGYGVFLHEGSWFGHEGGDSGCEVQVQRQSAPGVNVIALCNMNGLVDDVHDLLLDAVRTL